MSHVQSRLIGVWRVTVQDVKLSATGVYVKAMEKSLTTSASTVQVHWTAYQLGWFLAQQTGAGNLLGNLVNHYHLFK